VNAEVGTPVGGAAARSSKKTAGPGGPACAGPPGLGVCRLAPAFPAVPQGLDPPRARAKMPVRIRGGEHKDSDQGVPLAGVSSEEKVRAVPGPLPFQNSSDIRRRLWVQSRLAPWLRRHHW
jgi:hypothetical protein